MTGFQVCAPAKGKLEAEPEAEELYDYETDPLETRNLAADPGHAGVVARMRARAREYLTHSR